MPHDPGDSDATEAKAYGPVRIAQGVRLTVMNGPQSGESVVLRLGGSAAAQKAIVGRSQASDFRLADSTASSFHVELSVRDGAVHARDLNSRNGTVYAGARIEAALLPSGAILEIGSSMVRLDLDAPVETQSEELDSFGQLVGRSRGMREIFSLLARLARTELSILIEGPTGTGKELAARAVHDASAHARGPLVVLDCTSIPPQLAESVLFGHERGAFTGAIDRRPGVFEAAGSGTVFIDEIGELPMELQPKLLRVLEARQVQRIGSSQPIPVSARVLSATWRDLRARVNQKEFREDLYYRLAQTRVTLPSLAERPEDIPLLVQHFLARLSPSIEAARTVSEEALRELQKKIFPGNVRELLHTVERTAMLANGPVIMPSDLAFERILTGERSRAHASLSSRVAATPSFDGSGEDLPLFKDAKRTLVDEFEREYLEQLVTRVGRNLSKASVLAGVERHHLRELLKKHGLRGNEEGSS